MSAFDPKRTWVDLSRHGFEPLRCSALSLGGRQYQDKPAWNFFLVAHGGFFYRANTPQNDVCPHGPLLIRHGTGQWLAIATAALTNLGAMNGKALIFES